MKSFKGYLLNEVAWTESLSTMLFDLPRAGFADIHIPLSPSIFKRIWPKPVRTKAFHLTDLQGVQRLKKLQGSKRSISAFYNMTDYMIQSGIRTDGGYVVELEGDVLAASPDDLSTQPDKSGRRWITVSTLINSPTDSDPGLGGKSKLAGLEEDIKALLTEIVKNPKKLDQLKIKRDIMLEPTRMQKGSNLWGLQQKSQRCGLHLVKQLVEKKNL